MSILYTLLLLLSATEKQKESSANERGSPQPMLEVLEDLGNEDYQYDEEFEVSIMCTMYM